ncbi:hypothetical protein [Bradyrhizobium jicamae]|uniref:hypothetical protein n=1 Tax=Bradyrhizobium jicamae TaxID=280332 RepID=UPI000B18EFD7|nr:hypothetical protein [Bradyrhizobium jicamae]
MSRHAIFDRAMTAAERQRRHRKALAAKEVAKPAAPTFPAMQGGLPLNLEHLRRYPDRVAPFLLQRLGRDCATALRDALTRSLGEPSGQSPQGDGHHPQGHGPATP